MSSLKSKTLPTTPFADQKPGTSGLRKSTKRFQESHYVENFVQSYFNAISADIRSSSVEQGKRSLVVGGDARYFSVDCIKKIIKLAAANPDIDRLIVAKNGLMSTPAVSAVIRKYKAYGGLILTASHNPGGPDADFGIKFNSANGGPALSALTDKVFELSTKLAEYHEVTESPACDLTEIGEHNFVVDEEKRAFSIKIIDSVDDYSSLMKEIFDFDKIKAFLASGKCKLTVNSLNGVMGPYVKRILCGELGMPESEAINCEPMEDFGGLHPDPNLTYAKSLVDLMKKGEHDFGAAFDGDGDRNMILGRNAFFVCPCDSIAVLAAHLEKIPYFKREGVKGFARSMPTSGALDLVAKSLGKECYETPTGWKFFGNLMDAGKLSLCGEESFGTGSDHIREKDGLWAVLAWLSVLEANQMTCEEMLTAHWTKFGRNFFTRYDFEDCDNESAKKVMEHLKMEFASKDFVGRAFKTTQQGKEYRVKLADDFQYTDPVDKSLTTNQGLRIVFDDGSRCVFRLSGTSSTSATIRLYVDSYESDATTFKMDAQQVLRPLIDLALELGKFKDFVNRTEPTVIT